MKGSVTVNAQCCAEGNGLYGHIRVQLPTNLPCLSFTLFASHMQRASGVFVSHEMRRGG